MDVGSGPPWIFVRWMREGYTIGSGEPSTVAEAKDLKNDVYLLRLSPPLSYAGLPRWNLGGKNLEYVCFTGLDRNVTPIILCPDVSNLRSAVVQRKHNW